MKPPEWRLGGHTPDPQVRPDVPWLPPPPETIEWSLGGGREIMVWRPAGADEATAPEWQLRSAGLTS